MNASLNHQSSGRGNKTSNTNVKAHKSHPEISTTKTATYKGVAKANVYTLPLVAPRWYQLPAWQAFNAGIKNIIISLPRRHGKDITSTSMAVQFALDHANSSVILMAPTKAWAKRIWWNVGQEIEVQDPVTRFKRILGGSMLDMLIPDVLRLKTNQYEARIYLYNGSIIELQGSDELTFVGQRINCLVVSEMASHKPEIFPLLAPVLDESQGTTLYNGTVTHDRSYYWEFMNNVRDMPEDYHVTYMTAADTKRYAWVSPPDDTGYVEFNVNPELLGLINPETGVKYNNIHSKLRAGQSKSFLIREYLNIPTNVEEGSYYEELMSTANYEGRISNLITYNPDEPTYTAWDLGLRDKTCVVYFQYYDKKIYVIDYTEDSGKQIKHFIDIVQSKPYNYHNHFAPHDAKRKSAQTGMNLLDHCRLAYDFHFSHIPKTRSVIADIQIVRAYMSKCHFLKFNTHDLTTQLNKYRENQNTGQPKHDQASDPADAFRYAIMAIHKALLSPHALMGNTKTRKRTPLYNNISDAPTNKIIDPTGNFVTNVDHLDHWDTGNTFIGDIFDDS